jgi:hypothetical protein
MLLLLLVLLLILLLLMVLLLLLLLLRLLVLLLFVILLLLLLMWRLLSLLHAGAGVLLLMGVLHWKRQDLPQRCHMLHMAGLQPQHSTAQQSHLIRTQCGHRNRYNHTVTLHLTITSLATNAVPPHIHHYYYHQATSIN